MKEKLLKPSTSLPVIRHRSAPPSVTRSKCGSYSAGAGEDARRVEAGI